MIATRFAHAGEAVDAFLKLVEEWECGIDLLYRVS